MPLQYKVVSTALMILIKNTLRITRVRPSLDFRHPACSRVETCVVSCRRFPLVRILTVFGNDLIGCELHSRCWSFSPFSHRDTFLPLKMVLTLWGGIFQMRTAESPTGSSPCPPRARAASPTVQTRRLRTVGLVSSRRVPAPCPIQKVAVTAQCHGSSRALRWRPSPTPPRPGRVRGAV